MLYKTWTDRPGVYTDKCVYVCVYQATKNQHVHVCVCVCVCVADTDIVTC
jgi:hypothetical protein